MSALQDNSLQSVLQIFLLMCPAVYHVTESGWKKVSGNDVTELHFEYYPQPELHPANATQLL